LAIEEREKEMGKKITLKLMRKGFALASFVPFFSTPIIF
jgi:hypothetical protein